MLSDALLEPLEESFTLSAPMCSTAPSSRTAAPTRSSTTRPMGDFLAGSRVGLLPAQHGRL